MTGDQGMNLLYLLLLFVLVGSAFFGRRVPVWTAIRMLFGWLLIFGAAYLLFVARDDLRPLLDRVQADLNPDAPVAVGDTLRVPMAADGHFWIRGTIGDAEVSFLVDSGATTTALSNETVEAAGLDVDQSRPVLLQTANGMVAADRVGIPALRVGSIELRDFDAITSPAFGNTNVLGMNFLSTLTRWGVERRTLVLTP